MYWKSKQAATNCSTSFRIGILIQVKFSLRRVRVLATPIWAPVGDECYSINNVGMKKNPRGSQIRPSFRIRSWTRKWSGYVIGAAIIAWCKWTKVWSCRSFYLSMARNIKEGTDKNNRELETKSGILDKASTTTLDFPDRYWMERSYLMRRARYICYSGVWTTYVNSFLRLRWSVIMVSDGPRDNGTIFLLQR